MRSIASSVSVGLLGILLTHCGDAALVVDPPTDAAADTDVVPLSIDAPAQDSPVGTDAPAVDAAAVIDVRSNLDVPAPADRPAPIDAPEPADRPAPIDVPVSVDVPSTVDVQPPAMDVAAAVCPRPVEVIVYDQGAWNVLADALHDSPSPCADYWLSIPGTSADPTMLRAAAEPARVRAQGRRFHALAEFHWGGWSRVAGMGWYEKGVEFRRRMAAAGYDLGTGDAWEINELPSTARTDATTRRNVRDAMRGLFTGPPGSPTVRGAVFVIGFGQGTAVLTTYRASLRDWLTDSDFWVDANRYARWWAQEVYADPSRVCVPSTTVAERSAATNAYAQHPARLAAAAGSPASVNTAQSYLGRAYVPVLSAVWQSAAYGTDALPLATMQHFVSGQVHAVRSWSNDHPYPDGRIGFAWDHADRAAAADERALADRLASAVHHAYDDGGGSAAGACSPSGAYTWCQCSLAGARFNAAWDGFATW
jgi:hypothetical protein